MRKALKILLYVLCALLLLLTAAIIALDTQWGQNIVRGRAEAFLKGKLKTEVHIGYLGVGFPKFIVIKDILVKDQKQDTLLALGVLKVDISMLKLISKKVVVQQLVLSGVHGHVYRTMPDTTYNFSYIIDAFTGGPKTPEEAAKPKDTSKTSKPFTIDLDKVKLDDIHIRFDDQTGGMKLAVDLDHLDLRMKKLDLGNMSFHIKSLAVQGLATSFAQDTSYLPVKPKTDTSRPKLQLKADDIDLQNIAFNYNDVLHKLLFGLKLGSLQLDLDNFVLEQNLVAVNKLAMSNTDIALTIGKNTTPPAPIDTIIRKDTTEGWNVTAKNINFAGVNFKMDNENQAHQPRGIDYAHLDAKKLDMDLRGLRYSSDSISGDLKHLAVTEHSGVDVRELRTTFAYNDHGAILDKLYLQTPHTVLQDHVEVHYLSLATIKDSLASMLVNVNVVKSTVGISDVLIFVPDLISQEAVRRYSTSQLKLEAKMAGRMDNLNIARFYVLGLGGTEALLSGRLTGLPDANKLGYDLNIAKLRSTREDVRIFVPDSLLSSIRLPDQFGVTGHVAGTIKDYNTNLYLTSSDGLAYVRGTVLTSPGKGKERYDLVFNTAALNVGRIIKKDTLLGEVTANFVVKGQSFDPKTMNATVDGNIISAFANKYRYHDIKLYAKMSGQKGDIDLMSADPNLRILVKGNVDLSGKYAAAKADIKIDSIDFRALKLYKTELRASGTIHLDFPELNPDYPNGDLVWWQPTVTADGSRYYLDSLTIHSHPTPEKGQDIAIDLDVLTAKLTGRIPLTRIGPILEEHIERHYSFPLNDSIKKARRQARMDSLVRVGATRQRDSARRIPGSYDLKINARIIDKPMLHSLLPGLTSFDSIHIDGSLSRRTLVLNVLMPNIVYGSTTIDNGKVAINGTDSAFTYKVTADRIQQGKFSLWFADIHGKLDPNTITTSITLADGEKKERFALAATMKKYGDTQVVQLSPRLKLNYNDWTVDSTNRIVLANGGLYIQNFSISNNGQFIKANSDQPRINAPLKVEINDFSLANLTEPFSNGDTLLAGGTLSGNVMLQQLTPSPKLDADLTIKQLSVLRDTLGDLHILASNKNANAIDANITLKGEGNDIAVTGNYYLEPQNGNDFDLTVAVNALALKSFEGLAGNQIRNSSGFVRGKLEVKGKPMTPRITGELHTDNLATTISQLNAPLKMPSESITFANDLITFDGFTLQDNSGNAANVDGTVNIARLTNMKLDLRVNARNWHPLHSTIKDNKMFYGDLYLTTNLKINGPISAPSIDGSVNILKNTNLTIVNPDKDPELESRKGIVVFVNMKDTARRNILAPKKKRDSTRTTVTVGSGFNVNVTVDKAAQFTLVVDQASGDFLNVRGEATLNASMSPSGNLGLAGTYALEGGAYQLNYNFIKRKFLIKQGSVITFAGDPVKGTNLDVTATYETQVAPYDLVQRQVADPAQLNYYKQRMTFDVDLHMRGPVLKPALTFDINLPENKVSRLSTEQVDLIQSKLSQVRTDTSELNKQVFAILILNRFVSDDPFSSGASTSTKTVALQSVSTFIGEQLNQAAGKFIKGVDFSVDLATTEDYTTGDMRQRTDLNLAASKQLLNDRLKLTIGNNFELEGPQTANNTQSSYVPSNLAADYMLSADGKYIVRAYRKAYDEGVLQGFVTETGVNFIVSLEFNKFKNAIKNKKKRQVSDTLATKGK